MCIDKNRLQRFAEAAGEEAADAGREHFFMAHIRALTDFGTPSLRCAALRSFSATRCARAPGMARRAEKAAMRINKNWLQRFAEGGAGTAGEGAADAAPAADAGQQTNGKAEAAADKGQTAPRPGFEELIKGPYKAEFDAKVQSIVKGRLARAQKTEAAAAKMQGVLDVLAQRYGKDGADYDGILQALNGDTALYEREAAEAGMNVQQYMRMRALERENAAARRQQALHLQEAQARAAFGSILRQGEALRQKYPGFDLRAEMTSPGAMRLLKAGIPLETVYELNHRRELAAAAVTEGAQRVAAGVAANQNRPAEAGSAGTGSVGTGIDPARLTRAQRADIKRRVANGERIVLADYAPK